MLAVVKHNKIGAVLEDVPKQECQAKDIMIKVSATSICGSDINRYDWKPGRGIADFKIPLILGHEVCGDIIRVGDDAGNLKIGTRVVAETHIPCGYCYQCETSNQHICDNVKIFGLNVNGCFSEYFTFPAKCARPVPQNLSDSEAPLMEPLGVAYHALSKSNITGDTVAIIGCGPIGLLAIQIAKHMGATKIIAFGRSKHKLQLALKFGADKIIDTTADSFNEDILKLNQGKGIGTVIEASGSEIMFLRGLQMIRKGGIFVVIGMPKNPIGINFTDIIRKEITIHGIHGRELFDTWHSITSLVEQNWIDLKSIISAELPLKEFIKAFSYAKSSDHLKVLLMP